MVAGGVWFRPSAGAGAARDLSGGGQKLAFREKLDGNI